MKHQLHRGFTLIEVMVVVAIVAILAAIAYPAYTQYVLRSHRAEARNMLLEAAQFMEKNYTLSQSYAEAASGGPLNNASLTDAGLRIVPRGEPVGSPRIRYLVTFLAGPVVDSYTLRAVPQGAQADDPCKTLTLNNLQQKGVVGASLTSAECWSR